MGLKQWLSHGVRCSVVAAGVALSACGGGTQVVEFDPQRVLAFGDETSLINSDGSKYTINALDDTGAPDCAANPVWTQSLAAAFGIVFAQCNPNDVAEPQGRMLAANGAKAADLKTQVDNFAATDTFVDSDLATMLVGANDILELYAQYPTLSEDAIVAQLTARGEAYGQQINRVAQAGPAVLVLTVPDLGTSPFGIAEKAGHTDTDRAVLLRTFTDAFNAGMRLTIINDGRLIGLAFADEELRRVIRFTTSLGFEEVKLPACLATAVLPACTSDTLVDGGSSTSWLWADDRHFSPGFHTRLRSIAETRVRNNPF
jgi:outer membrane lipase/esterase